MTLVSACWLWWVRMNYNLVPEGIRRDCGPITSRYTTVLQQQQQNPIEFEPDGVISYCSSSAVWSWSWDSSAYCMSSNWCACCFFLQPAVKLLYNRSNNKYSYTSQIPSNNHLLANSPQPYGLLHDVRWYGKSPGLIQVAVLALLLLLCHKGSSSSLLSSPTWTSLGHSPITQQQPKQ